ncbi:hypothetical protein MMYC01_201307 [Madurella mycetomatis]|uniref:Uncharacterized protein n=1 Tax=Madurella mycetomatis TaxID=100816 RepID=A0A175WFU5_9PEZI|nr:hypothetical protein MMYC01_201307 [Madurella mycetomatis]
MCDYTQREHRCDHFRWIASRWCQAYAVTHKRCTPNVTHFEYKPVLCGECKAKFNQEPCPWEHLIRRPNTRSAISF